MAASLEERVAYLEGKAEEQTRLGGDLREIVVQMDRKVDRVRDELIQANAATNSRMDLLDQKVDRVRDELAGRIDTLDRKWTGCGTS